MIIKANNTFVGILDLSSLERLQESNPLESLQFRRTIKPNQIIEVEDKWYWLTNIQSALKLGHIEIFDYKHQVVHAEEISTPEAVTTNLNLAKVAIVNRSDFPQKEFQAYNENMDFLDSILQGTNTGDQESSDFNLADLADVDKTDKSEGKILKVNADGKHVYVTDESGTDEKVKYNAGDPAAGYLADKLVAGDGIGLGEGTGTNENKLVVTNNDSGSGAVGAHEGVYDHTLIATALQAESDPVFTGHPAYGLTSEDMTDIGNLSGSNTGDQSASDFDLADLADVDKTDKSEGKILQVNAQGKHVYVTIGSSADEKVKLNALDPSAGYLDAKLQEGISAIQFNMLDTPLASAPGLMQWNATEGTYDVGLFNSSVLQVGQETMFYGKASGNISNGDLCQFDGVQGNHILMKKAIGSEVEANPHFLLGVATENILNGLFGYVTCFGKVNNIYTKTPNNQDSENWIEGDVLYFNVVTGQMTKIKPFVPNRIITIAAVIKQQTGSSESGIIIVRSQIGTKLVDLDDVDGTPLVEDGQILTWHNTEQYFDFDKNINNYKNYSGFENQTDSLLSIDSGTGVLQISPSGTSFDIYSNGFGKHTITSAQSVTITEDQTITYVFLDGNGALQKMTEPWDLTTGENSPCAIVFKDGSAYSLTDERHGYERNKAWHNWAHFNIGAMYKSGLTGTFTNTTMSIAQGVIYDEDLRFDTQGTKTSTTLWYRNATDGMRMIRNSTTPYYAVGGVLKYDNGSGTLQDVDNNKYTTIWVYCGNDSEEPIYTVIGQNNDTNLSNARNVGTPIINLSTAEWKLIYRLIYRNAGGTPTYIESSDFREVQTGVPTTSISPTSHTSLINRDAENSHPASAIQVTWGVVASDMQSVSDIWYDTVVDFNAFIDSMNGEVVP
jgi:hypothetical protein